VIQAAQAMADITPETITYVEAHGTGTPLGDPIELAALTQVFAAKTQQKGVCAVGSVKTNLGHLGPAAGVAGLIKTVLALKHKQIPPSLHFQASPLQFDFANTPFYVNATLSDWQTNTTPRRAGVSSFGFGGTNAHVILEEAPIAEPASPSRPWHLLQLSAKTSSALDTATANLANYLQQHPDVNLADVAYTLQVGRRSFNHRRILVCQSLDDAVNALTPLDPQRVLTRYQEAGDCPVVFMFPGQGTQYVNMGREIYQEPIFQSVVDDCCKRLKPHLGLDLRAVLYPDEAQVPAATQQLTQTRIAQPALFVMEYALSQLWMAWGVHPNAMIGHSIGEYVAACLAGVFSLDDALAIVATRGRLMQQCSPGAMLSVQLAEPEVRSLLSQKLSSDLSSKLCLAAVNAPSLCVVSGSIAAIDRLQQQLQHQGISYRRLHTSHAFHSPMMEPILEPFTQAVRSLNLNPPQIPFISNVSGTWITAVEATDPNYWANHLRRSVRFSDGMAELLKQPERILLEVGPGRTLSTFAKHYQTKHHQNRKHQSSNSISLTSIRHPQEQQSDIAVLLSTLGRLWLAGVPVNWSGVSAHERRRRLPLPTYPFERQRYWIEPKPLSALAPRPEQPLNKKLPIADWFYLPVWQESLPIQRFNAPQQGDPTVCWLIFVDKHGIGASLAQRLEQCHQTVITVRMGEQFTQISESDYAVHPQQREDYDALIQAIQMRGLTLQAIAHCWSITSSHRSPYPTLSKQIERVEACQQLGCYSLLFLAQALGRQRILEPLKLTVLTNNVYDVTGDEPLCPEKATVLGFCKVIPQEYPNITCHHLDIAVPEPDNKPNPSLNLQSNSQVIECLVAELMAPPTDLVVAYRGHHRWVQTFTNIPSAAPLSSVSTSPASLGGQPALKQSLSLRQEGVYLITGGLGSIGLVLAEYLAQTVQAKLILIGRSEFPERSQWELRLTSTDEPHPEPNRNPINHRIRTTICKLQAIEALGSEVLILQADVANELQMQAAIAQAVDRFGDIHGVIHAAGAIESSTCPIQETTPATVQLQFQPKVQGLLVLHHLLQGKSLDFCLLFSSLASVLGGLGFASYAAANLFMDAFVHKSKQTHQIPWISVNWDHWRLSDETKSDETKQDATKATLFDLFMTPQEGINAFEQVLLLRQVAQVVVSTGDLQTRIDQWLKLISLRETATVHPQNAASSHASSSHARPSLSNSYVMPRNDFEQRIAAIWQRLLGIDQIGIYDNFFELGGHSLLATQVISHVRQTFRVELPIRHLFEHPTIADQAVAVQQYQYQFKNQYSNEFENQFGNQTENIIDCNHPIPRLNRSNPQQLLAQINQLSDQETETLLNALLAEQDLAP
jgi:acyl transferase domain-containing protein/acyl carrier protein